jgi:hypothetical protein
MMAPKADAAMQTTPVTTARPGNRAKKELLDMRSGLLDWFFMDWFFMDWFFMDWIFMD